jgi:hypothetical protein
LLRLGLARAAPELAGQGCATALLKAEGEGREAEAGHWADDGFAMLSPKLLDLLRDWYRRAHARPRAKMDRASGSAAAGRRSVIAAISASSSEIMVSSTYRRNADEWH